ncbi:uncharacterized protein HRG_09101 [Hirsutella rhossiliensis]|uniref:Membrane protein n=1 Tax=Hirsutella rhossiliensis TaxID=111463 RepID=A0A9P8SG53_9HYPO|nr:uncharacterized protein HRG_09101 [Hirsutella rhossiliensis]KAH0960080.1 putative membrane protein [Hirsutella rhossiliensis]
MLLAWVLILPAVAMLSLAKSRYTLVSRLCFLAVNALGLVLGIVYDARTPDLYPNSAHGKIGWVVTWAVSAQALVNLVSRASSAVANRPSRSLSETLAFIPASPDPVDTRHRLSDNSGQGTEPHTDLDKEYSRDDDDDEPATGPLSFSGSATSLSARAAKLISTRAWRYLDLCYQVIDRLILPLGFVALTTGVATFGRLFEGQAIFSGLAHWIKGGVFFWLGLFTLGRWTGSFGELGWAWNLRPRPSQRMWRPSAELVESALIFVYGSTNIFLEHLGNWGGAWSSQDLEHAAITVLFIGGGLCGMLVESTRIRHLLNTAVSDATPENALSDEERQRQNAPATYELSLNPIPALVILLLGIMMGSHQQSTMISTMVHKQWGNLLLGASLARGLTYVLMFLRPPKSALPSRPPTELLASFGLIAGGIVFMASSSDTVAGMIHYELDAMFILIITMGLVGTLMAWEVIVLAIKGWATRREWRVRYRALS